jgi:hypothetical protein
MAHEAIGTGCDEARASICFRHEAPRGTKLGPGSMNEGGAPEREEAP